MKDRSEYEEESKGEAIKMVDEEGNGLGAWSYVYTESNANLNLTLVEAMLTRPDLTRVTEAPVFNPLPFQVFLMNVPAHNTSSKCFYFYKNSIHPMAVPLSFYLWPGYFDTMKRSI